MNEGVKILIERMKTNPEEFTGTSLSTKWGQIIRLYEDYLEPEDQKALSAGVNKIQQQAFTETVMKELLAPEEDDSLGKQWYTKQTAMPLGVWANAAVDSQSYKDAQQLQMEQVKLHLDAHREALKAEEKKPHKTLFGKLFNYS